MLIERIVLCSLNVILCWRSYASQMCRFGATCQTENCLYFHPPESKQCDECSAVGVLSRVDPSCPTARFCAKCWAKYDPAAPVEQLHSLTLQPPAAGGEGASAAGADASGGGSGGLQASAGSWQPGQVTLDIP